ncbi:MAG TPA: hypothetical protein VN794_01695 [Methylomirabilota bacterium]|nr:hypothetical protein [Methylomirabilota bacterium]
MKPKPMGSALRFLIENFSNLCAKHRARALSCGRHHYGSPPRIRTE